MNRTKKLAMLIATTICSAVLSVVTLFDVGLALKVKAEPAIGGEKKTVAVTDASALFEAWNNDTSTYGVNETGVWRKDNCTTGNRQIPIKESLTISKTKDAYLKFALPVYDAEGNKLADKVTEEIILHVINDRKEEMWIKFFSGDADHATGVNYNVGKIQLTGVAGDGWCGYWCSTRIPGDFTATNFIGIKFADRAGENISMLKADGTWYADPSMNEADGARTDVTAFFANATSLKLNFTYWGEGKSADTNLELVLQDFDGTVYTCERIDEDACYVKTESALPEVTFNGKTVTVPAAKGYFGKNEVDASVIVIDSDDNEVALTDGKFTANTGIYKVIYNAEYNGITASIDYIVTVYSGEKTMDIPANPDDYFRGWISGPSVWDENGLTSIDNSGYDVANGHQRQSFYQADFNIENDKDVTMTVSIPIYNADGTRRNDRLNHADNKIDWVDMMIVDIDANKEFRIRMIDTYSAKGVTEFFGSYFTGDPYASAANGNGGWINRYANTAIKGTFTQESSFTFRVTGTENEHFQVIAPDGTWKNVGSAADVTDDMYSLTLALNTFFKNTKNVRIGFYYWASSAFATENDNLAVTYKNINGQTFIPVDGKIADEIAPVVGAAVASSKETVLKTGANYIYGVSFVDEIFENVDARKLVYRKKGTTEWKETGIFNKDSNKITSCKFEEAGDLEIAIKAVDFAGNVGYGEISEVKVEKGYDITINGEIPEMGETGKKITLPGATASDKNGVTREVTVSVEDASGKIAKMDSENSFTPEKPGTYYIIYTSSYKDGDKLVSTDKELTITVRAGSDTSSKKDDGCKSSVSLFGLSTLALLAGATFIVKKKNDR